ncbi:sodium/hydrogen exchanger 6 [Tanacetum coccineum]|uniref:Sodium/hydrogen exchanger 6 n=1 Tax=Tanacetum coccineum TaxID=301880 RepID=A0ABQ4ZR37_9ASTR
MNGMSTNHIIRSVEVNAKLTSYVSAANASVNQPKEQVNFRSMVADKVFDGVNISIPRKVVEKVSLRFENTLYGYFIGKRMAFPVVEYFVKNNWAKYGLKRIMVNAKGFFFFKFDSRTSLDAVLEEGPWMICNSLIILKKWSVNTSLKKEEMSRIPIWVKLHDVPIQVFKEDGISLISSYLGKLIMLDSYTTTMCKESWGRSSFARCLIEINAEVEFTESITIGIPELEGTDYIKETIRVKYEWKPPRLNKKRNNKKNATGNPIPRGVPVAKGFKVGKQFNYQPKAPNSDSNGGGNHGTTSPKLGQAILLRQFLMFSIASWNIMGLNRSLKQKEVRLVVNENNLSVCAILESHVDVAIVYDTCKKVNTHADNKTLFCSFVYADNYYIDRRVLWNNLARHAGLMRNTPWFLLAMEVADVNSTGLHFTWNQKPKGSNGTLKKIDRIMGNLQFNDDFLGSFAIFQPYRILDHSLCFLRIPTVSKPKPKPFKFSNFLVYKKGFLEIVESGWNVNIEGYAMFRVVKRLKGLKSPFRKLLHDHGNLYERVNKLCVEIDKAHKAIDRDPSSSILREEHAHYLFAFKEAQMDEERFLKQKAKVEWLKACDSNTTYFHKIVKSKCTRNRIEMVSDSSNTFYDGNQVPGAFVKHYNQFLGAEGVTNPLDAQDIFIRMLDNSKADYMIHDVTNDEIKSVMFYMGDDRAPSVDGFTAAFFKKVWDVCISKIIANRVKEGLGDIVSINQSAFVPGRRIYDNILLTQELMRNYHRRRGPPRWSNGLWCAFQVPLTLSALMVICMDILREKERRVRNSDEFQYHHLCDQQRIINLCFDDDLFLFARGHPSSVSIIMDALEEFKQVSGLVPSIPKSTAYFCNVPNAIKAYILNSMPFAEGVLPIRCQGEMKKRKAKVAWDSVCMPKQEGGLGIRRIEDFNIALMATHIWSILTHRESIWVKWLHTYKLKGRSFWDVPCRGDVSWGWRKLLQIRSTIIPFIWHKINNGKSTSAWFDRWADVCPIKDLLSNRDITRSGFSLDDSVSNLISDGVWRWPIDWLSRFPILAHLHVPLLLDDLDDVILWRDRDGVLWAFSVACVWDTIRTRADIVNWYNAVWFSHCIPRHAIHMWLFVQQKLKTQDRLRQWNVGPSIDLNLLKCLLCDLVPDSHDHLFFECAFSSQLWSKVRVLYGMDVISPRLMDVVSFIVPISKAKTVVSILSRIVVSATSYYIWLERNGRLFKKKTTKSRLLLDQWKILSYCIDHDRSPRQSHLDLSCSYRVAAGLRDVCLIIFVGVVGSVEDGIFVVGGVSCCLELSVGEEDLLTLEVPELKNSSYKGPNRRSNSCCNGAVVSAEGETFCSWGARPELS